MHIRGPQHLVQTITNKVYVGREQVVALELELYRVFVPEILDHSLKTPSHVYVQDTCISFHIIVYLVLVKLT